MIEDWYKIRDYIDARIKHWRVIYNDVETGNTIGTVAGECIDELQKLRHAIFGEVLSD